MFPSKIEAFFCGLPNKCLTQMFDSRKINHAIVFQNGIMAIEALENYSTIRRSSLSRFANGISRVCDLNAKCMWLFWRFKWYRMNSRAPRQLICEIFDVILGESEAPIWRCVFSGQRSVQSASAAQRDDCWTANLRLKTLETIEWLSNILSTRHTYENSTLMQWFSGG